MAILSRNQIATLNRLLSMQHSIATNSLYEATETVWVMNTRVGHKLAKTYVSLVVNKYHGIGTDLPDTHWVVDAFGDSRVLYCEALPDDVIGYTTVERGVILSNAKRDYVQALFTPEGRNVKAYRRNQWGVQFAVDVLLE